MEDRTDVLSPSAAAPVLPDVERDAGSDAAGRPETRGGPPRRLRGLRGRDLALTLIAFALVVVPFVVALVRAYGDHWVPSGDEANIATRSLDVISRHPPLTGLPSTSFLYGEKIFTYHPGPAEFFVLALPLRMFGATSGPLLTAAFVNAAFVMGALWVFLRRTGPVVMLWAAVVVQLVIWSAGTAVLVDTLSSNMTLYPLLGTAVLAWGVADGDYRLLPVTALGASYAAQQHLAGAFVVGTMSLAALVMLVVGRVRRARSTEPLDHGRVRPWALGALAIFVVCWIPVILDEIRGHPGNLTAIWNFARDNQRETLGFAQAVRQLVHAVVPPTVIGRTDTSGPWFIQPTNVLHTVAVIAIVGAVIATIWLARKQSPALSRLAVITTVLFAAGLWTGSNFPQGIEVNRVNLYRWTWTAAFLTWTVLGWGIGLLARRYVPVDAVSTRARRLAPVALLVIAALIATTTVVTRGADDRNREFYGFATERRAGRAMLGAIDHHQPVLLITRGNAGLDIGANLIFRLVQAGIPVKLEHRDAIFLGRHRAATSRTRAQTIVVRSAAGVFRPMPGRVLTRVVFDPEYTKVLDELTAQAGHGPVKLAPNANAVINRRYVPEVRPFVHQLFRAMEDKPREVVRNTVFLKLVQAGIVEAPKLDPTLVRRFLALSGKARTVLGDERLEVLLLTPDQLREVRAEGRLKP